MNYKCAPKNHENDEVDYIFKRSKRTIAEVLESMQKSFIEANGSLLTEEEAVEYVDRIRADLREKGLL